MKKLFLSLGIAALGFMSANAQGKLLVVHNSPDPAVATVDVWVEVPQAATYIKIVDDLSYKGAYFYSIPSIPVPGATLTVHLKSSNSTSSANTDLYAETFTSVPTGNNILIASGLVTPALKAAKPNPSGVANDFDLILKSTGVSFSSTDPTKASVAVHHGSVDAPKVYIQSFVTTIQAVTRDTLANDVPFKASSDHAFVPASARRVHVIPMGSPQTAAAYQANAAALGTLAGKAAFVVATGFLDTTGTGTTNSFKVYAYVTDAATPDGAITGVELPKEKLAGVTEIIHASPDTLLKKIELYVNGLKQSITLSYLQKFQSSGFIQDFPYDIDIHPNGSTTKALTVNLLLNGTSRVGVISGLVDTAAFTSNPDGKDLTAKAYIDSPFTTLTTAGNAVVNIFHASPDAPTVSATVPAVGGASIISGLAYGSFQKANVGGNPQLPTTLGNVVVDVRLPDNTIFRSYLVPLTNIDGQGVTVVAAGFVDPAANQGTNGFGMFLSPSALTFGALTPLSDVTSINDPSIADLQFRMFPNPASSELVMAFDMKNSGNVTIDILDMNGRVVKNVVNNMFDNGTVALTEDIRNLNSGVYIARVVSANQTSTYKFNVVK